MNCLSTQVQAAAFVKRKSLILLILFVHFLNCSCQKYSWCDPQLCGGSTTVHHIACHNYGHFDRRCFPDASDVDISKFKHVFVDEHNKRRNLIASGQLPGYYPAAKMATMVWDDELQYLAGLNVRTCILDHDDCNHTYRFRNTGQNLCGISRFKGNFVNITNLIDETITLWFDSEYGLIDNSFVKAFKVTSDFEAYGHFAEMIVDRNTHVGCAIMRFTRPDYPHVYIYNVVCNYASVYALGAPLYKIGFPGHACKAGRNPRFPALCSEREEFDPNY